MVYDRISEFRFAAGAGEYGLFDGGTGIPAAPVSGRVRDLVSCLRCKTDIEREKPFDRGYVLGYNILDYPGADYVCTSVFCTPEKFCGFQDFFAAEGIAEAAGKYRCIIK